MKKKEIAVALIAQLVGRPKTAVQNVTRVVRVDLAVGVKIVHRVMPEQETTMMQRNVNNVNWVKQPLKVPLNVILAMLEHLAKPRAFVQHARLDFIKTTKVKMNAANARWENCTSMPKQHAVIVTLEHLAKPRVSVQHARLVFIKTTKVKITASNATEAKRSLMLKPPVVIVTKVNMAVTMALVQHAQLVIFKIPKVKRNAEIRVSTLEKYPTAKAPGVNCHRGVPAKWANI